MLVFVARRESVVMWLTCRHKVRIETGVRIGHRASGIGTSKARDEIEKATWPLQGVEAFDVASIRTVSQQKVAAECSVRVHFVSALSVWTMLGGLA